MCETEKLWMQKCIQMTDYNYHEKGLVAITESFQLWEWGKKDVHEALLHCQVATAKEKKTKTQDQTCIFHPAPGPKSKDFCLYYGLVGSNTLVIDTEIA